MPMFRALAVAALVIVAGCSGGSTGYGGPPPPPPPGPPPPPPPGGGHSTTITVSNNQFTPTPDTIPAGTITFTWAPGAVTHNVTWQTGPNPLPTGSGNRAAGDADYAPTVVVGNYTYHCTIHAGMNGVLVVQ
ncbi:MAG: cupredoxin domain-containing protein [Gemmatimonadales bacterium]